MKKQVTIAVVLLILIGFPLPLAAAEATGEQEESWWLPQRTGQGFFIDPGLMFSFFVTDKGQITRRADAQDYQKDLDVHTGDWNWLLYPNLGLGWDFTRWQVLLRTAYPMHFINLNLPHNQTADGTLTSFEMGPEFYFHVADFWLTSLEIGFGGGVRFAADADLDYLEGETSARLKQRDFSGLTDIPGFSAHVGAGGELMSYSVVRLGWLARFYWGHYEMTSDADFSLTCDGVPCEVDEENLNLNVYSLLFGFRLRIFPMTRETKHP